MISSREEALLVLKKWKEEDSPIVAYLLDKPGMVMRSTGKVAEVSSEDKTFSFVHDDEHFMYFSLHKCRFGYGEIKEITQALPGVPVHWQSALFIVTARGLNVCLFCI